VKRLKRYKLTVATIVLIAIMFVVITASLGVFYNSCFVIGLMLMSLLASTFHSEQREEKSMHQQLYVCNLDYSINEAALKDIFAKFGEVETSKLIRDRKTGTSKGFGFVRMVKDDAENALQHLNKKEVRGRPLVVKYARPRYSDSSNYNN